MRSSYRLFSSSCSRLKQIITQDDSVILTRMHGFIQNKNGEPESYLTLDEAKAYVPRLVSELKLRNTMSGSLDDSALRHKIKEHVDFGARNGIVSWSSNPYAIISRKSPLSLMVFSKVDKQFAIDVNALGLTHKPSLYEYLIINYPNITDLITHVILPRDFYKLDKGKSVSCIKTGKAITLEDIYGAKTPAIKKSKDHVQTIKDEDDQYNSREVYLRQHR